MKAFVEAYFKRFGAKVQPHDQFPNELIVDLPPDLAQYFNKPRLYLVFPQPGGDPPDLSPHEDLVVYGSRTFDEMLALLEGRGEGMVLQLSAQSALETTGDLSFPLPLENCLVQAHQVQAKTEQFFIFNFRVIFASDEKQEDFITIILDDGGQPRLELERLLTSLILSTLPQQPATLDGNLLGYRLSQAEAVARQQLAPRAAKLQTEIQLRLQKPLLRLTTYYRRLTEEINVDDVEQANQIRADLHEDLVRKVAEELERHHLRVTLKPLSFAVVDLPLGYHKATLTTPHTTQDVTVIHNLHTGRLEPIPCHHCQEAIDRLALCDQGHVAHPHCIDTCTQCERDICQRCGIKACVLSGALICLDCVETCHLCQRWISTQFVETCAICHQPACIDHKFQCRWCGQSYCQTCVVDGLCQTCREAAGDSALSSEKPPNVPDTLPVNRYRWQYSGNLHFLIYWGRPKGVLAPLMSPVVIVIEPQTGRLIHWHKLSWWRRFFEKKDKYSQPRV